MDWKMTLVSWLFERDGDGVPTLGSGALCSRLA